MRSLLSTSLLTMGLLGLAANAPAWDRPNLSGTWKLNPAASTFGTQPVPQDVMFTIDHKHPFIHYSKTVSMADGTKRIEEVRMTVDGTKFDFKPREGARGEARWKNDGVQMTVNTDDHSYKATSLLRLDQYGKQLIEEITMKEKGKPDTQAKLVYDRQAP